MSDWIFELFRNTRHETPKESNHKHIHNFGCEYPDKPLDEKPAYVIAESYYHFTLAGLPKRCKYLGKLPEDIRGLGNCDVILLGRYWRRRDWDEEILLYCGHHNITITKYQLD